MEVIYKNFSDKIKNLQVEETYEVLSENGDFYTILNKAGKEANYHKRLFEVVPVIPPEPIWGLGEVRSEGDRQYISVLRNGAEELELKCYGNATNISCGIYYIGDIQTIIADLGAIDIPYSRQVELLAEALQSIIRNIGVRFGIISVTRDVQDFIDLLKEHFGEVATTTPWRVNLNSGNEICVMVIERKD